ncbi:MAG TPA: peptide chain release factor N(5)-glutamine methyltransferase [Candidatus Dormibacteraeota bacterium]|nr:peptide chain release factor N(5)-glutamine methyltransferase [Candidatus Dormibacteraeota bacterium]
MVTVAEAIARASERLRRRSDTPLLDAQLLMARVLERDRPWLIAHGDSPLPPEEHAQFERVLVRREEGVPVAYLIESAGFYGREFRVREGVLVPRPETEHLIERALAEIDRLAERGRRANVLDVGTGSGAIAVTVACERPDVRVVATDRSSAAVSAARANAERHGVAERVLVLHGELHEPALPYAPFDVVLGNLPYVPTADLPRRPEPAAYEPRLALDGGSDGLDVYRWLVPALPAILSAGGVVLMEAAPPTIEGLAGLARASFPDAAVEIVTDYGGRARVVCVLTREPGSPPRSATTQSEPSSSPA